MVTTSNFDRTSAIEYVMGRSTRPSTVRVQVSASTSAGGMPLLRMKWREVGVIASSRRCGGVTGVEILVKTGTYAACLAAAGSTLARLALSRLDDGTARTVGRLAVAAAVAGAALSVARIPVRASFLMGGTLSGAFEPPIVAMVVESPLGTSLRVRLAGLALICLVAVNRPTGRIAAGLGAVLVCASFALRGHTLERTCGVIYLIWLFFLLSKSPLWNGSWTDSVPRLQLRAGGQTMANRALSEARVRALKPRRSAFDIRDAKFRGFGVRVLPSGTKHYFIHIQHRGERVRKLVGDASAMAPDEARLRAVSLRDAIRRESDETLFEVVAGREFERYAHVWKARTLQVNRCYLRRQILPWFAGQQIADITRQNVERWFASLMCACTTFVTHLRAMPS